MATSSSHVFDCSLPEMVFHDWNDGKNKESMIKCPLCNNLANKFYCVDCVKNGNFTHSQKKCIERDYMFRHYLSRFADKKPKKYKLEEEKLNILKRYEEALSNKVEIENLKFNINHCREKIDILKKNIKISKYELSRGNKIIEKLKDKKKQSIQLQEDFIVKLRKLRSSQKLENAKLSIKESELSSKQSALQLMINCRVEELISHIFPITKVLPESSPGASPSAELEDAQNNTYIQGQWVMTGSPMDDMEYRIIKPNIPSTGDYSVYPAWCKILEGLLPGPFNDRNDVEECDRPIFDKAYGIQSVLTYASHIVSILSIYMDVHLPKRSTLQDFYKDDCLERFYHNVAKLNANIINLCLSQNVDISGLSAHRPISNLVLLIESKNHRNQRYLGLEEQEELLESLEDSIFKDVPFFDESDDSSESEFVHVSEDELFEVSECSSKESEKNSNSKCDKTNNEQEFECISNDAVNEVPESEPVTILPSSLVSSVFSLWRGATGLK